MAGVKREHVRGVRPMAADRGESRLGEIAEGDVMIPERLPVFVAEIDVVITVVYHAALDLVVVVRDVGAREEAADEQVFEAHGAVQVHAAHFVRAGPERDDGAVALEAHVGNGLERFAR